MDLTRCKRLLAAALLDHPLLPLAASPHHDPARMIHERVLDDVPALLSGWRCSWRRWRC